MILVDERSLSLKRARTHSRTHTMGSSSSDDEEAGLQRRRNARSLDMSSSREASKAAAWMWHMHSSSTSKKEREEKQPDYTAIWESKRRRSTSFDRKGSRFRQEATALASTSVSATTLKPVASPPSKAPEASIWDCGSKLYDTFELVSFSNRLDRSLLGIPEFETSNFRHVAQSNLQHHSTFAGVLRTFSLPHTLSVQNSRAMATPPANDDMKPSPHDHDVLNNDANSASNTKHAPLSDLQDTFVFHGTVKPKFSALRRVLTTKWSFSKLARVLKKVVKFRKQMQCFRPRATCSQNVIELMGDKEGDGGMSEDPCASCDKNVSNELVGDEDEGENGMSEHRYRVYEEKVNKDKVGKHFHHHHHHYHHHFVHQIDQFSQPFKEEDVYKLRMSAECMGTDAAWLPGRAESARLSSDTLSKICADMNWL